MLAVYLFKLMTSSINTFPFFVKFYQPGNFGHSGAGYVTMETAVAKNQALAEAGAVVPTSYDDIPKKLA